MEKGTIFAMILTDYDIEKRIEDYQDLRRRSTNHVENRLNIEPYRPENVQPASYDVTLGEGFLGVYNTDLSQTIDPRNDNSHLWQSPPSKWATSDGSIIIRSGEFVLGTTEEYFEIPDYIVARIEGKSSLARLGLIVHITAGFIDPGFKGKVTLEFYNAGPFAIKLTPGLKIAQISFDDLKGHCRRPYGHPERNSKYMNQMETTGSRNHLNYQENTNVK